MCYIELEPCDVWDERELTARKGHVCDTCRGAIIRGNKYFRHFSKFDGKITSEKICEACYADREQFAALHEHMSPSPGCTKDLISECLYEREDFRQMLKWARMLKRMDKRRDTLLPIITK